MVNVIASRYAEALFQIGEEENITSELYEEIKEVDEIIKENNDLNNVFKSPLVAKEEKKNLINELFDNKVNKNIINLMKILIDKNRMSSIKSIVQGYKELLDEKNNVKEGSVITAVAMKESELKLLEEKLSNKYNKNITLVNEVDSTVLGGVLVKLGNEEIDGTVKTRLSKMKEELSQVIS